MALLEPALVDVEVVQEGLGLFRPGDVESGFADPSRSARLVRLARLDNHDALFLREGVAGCSPAHSPGLPEAVSRPGQRECAFSSGEPSWYTASASGADRGPSMPQQTSVHLARCLDRLRQGDGSARAELLAHAYGRLTE